jgi:dCTP diphosphatase
MTNLTELKIRLRRFAAVREWEKFHTPKNISMALIVEAAELVEQFQWLTPDQSTELSADHKQAVEEEMADVLIYLTRLADLLDVDLLSAAYRKIELNEHKYPVHEVLGSAQKRSRG